jgi:hypothetical protein
MNKMHHILIECVAAQAEILKILDTNEIDAVLSVHVSASGPGKYIIFRNYEVVATLFTNYKNLQAEYDIPFPIRYKADDIGIKFISMERLAMNMYATVQTYTEPRLVLK